jgi:hypothetical protein
MLRIRLVETPALPDPFDHCVINDVFPVDFFNAAHQNWPGDGVVVSIEGVGRTDAYSERHVMLYEDRFFEKLSPSMQNFRMFVSKATTGGTIVQACLGKFEKILKPRIRHIKEKISLKLELLVVSDRTDYAIGPHTDLPSRFVSLLFYLSPDQNNAPMV